MSMRIVINLVHQSENPQIDVASVNEILMENSALSELYESVEPMNWFEGPLKFFGSKLKIAESDNEGYGKSIDVHYCWDMEVMQVIADHMSVGKLVFSENTEDLGTNTLYYILTPGTVETFTPSF